MCTQALWCAAVITLAQSISLPNLNSSTFRSRLSDSNRISDLSKTNQRTVRRLWKQKPVSIDKITGLVSTLTGGTTTAELGNFFANLRTMLNVGTGVGQINLLAVQTADALKNALFAVITGVTVATGAPSVGRMKGIGLAGSVPSRTPELP